MMKAGKAWVSTIDPLTVILEQDKSFTLLEGNHRQKVLSDL